MSRLSAMREPDGLVSRYLRNRRTAQPGPWRAGVSNQIDRRIDEGMSAREIAWELEVPRWLVVERFAVMDERKTA